MSTFDDDDMPDECDHLDAEEDILIGRLTCSCGWRHWLTPEESKRRQELQRQAEEAFEAHAAASGEKQG